MATEKKRSKGRFLYLFDWNSKSKKKLFSNKSESSEVCNQGKESSDNLVIPQYLLSGVHENEDRSSFRESGDYSCASSINGDELYETRAPGLVARLMGLDSMPSTSCDALYDTRALNSSYYSTGADAFQHEHHILDYGYVPNKGRRFPWSSMDSKINRVQGPPIERFQTEVLPPKSAKPISITHHKLLSPIKSPGFVPTKDAAYIMEAAARIIDTSPHPSGRVNIPSLSSPSSSFRLQDLKEKMDAAQRSSRISELSKTPKKSAVEQMRGGSSDKSSNRSLFKSNMGSEMSSSQKMKNKGKSVSVPVRDKGKIRRTEGLIYSDNRSRQRETKQDKLKPKHPSVQKARESRSSMNKLSSVLRPNSDKQNTVANRDKQTSKATFSDQQPRKIAPGSNGAGPSKIVSRVFVNVENRSKKVDTATNGVGKRALSNGVSEKRPSLNKTKSFSRIKQSAVPQNVPDNSDERSVEEDCLSSQSNSGKDLDVISFTFTSPIKKSGSVSLSPSKSTGDDNHQLGAESADSSHVNRRVHETSSVSLTLGLNVIDSGSLSHLLDQKLKELTEKIVSRSDSVTESFDTDSVSPLLESNPSYDVARIATMEYKEGAGKGRTSTASDDDRSLCFVSKSHQKNKKLEDGEELAISSSINECEASRESDPNHLNISVPDCSISSSCVSSSTTSNFTFGYDQEATSANSTESIHPKDDENDFADSASHWEVEYIRYALHYAGLKRFWLDKHHKIIDPAVFDLLENLINTPGRNAELCSKLDRRILFDCTAEIVTSKYERVFLGSHKAWATWEMLLRNDCLTEDVYKQVTGLQSMATLMVDEVVDRDMSCWHGRWLDFETESLEEGIDVEEHIVASLVDELVDDLCIQSFSR